MNSRILTIGAMTFVAAAGGYFFKSQILYGFICLIIGLVSAIFARIYRKKEGK